MAHGWTFLKRFAGRPGSVGAIAPSSKALATAMVDGLSVEANEGVLEFGIGTGAFTAAIAACLPDPAAYLGIEIEEPFVELCRKRFPELRFAHASAADAARLVDEHGLRPIRAVISGLPFASLPPTVQDGILTALDEVLEEGSLFRTFQYAHAYVLPRARRFRVQMCDRFGPMRRSKLVAANLPPAYALSWTR